jgi:ribosomal protein S18 acetylase RimI-like enzyme
LPPEKKASWQLALPIGTEGWIMSCSRIKVLLTQYFRNFFDVRRRHGTFAAVCSAVDRAASKAFGLCVSHVICFDLQQKDAMPSEASGLTCRFLTPDDIRLFAVDPSNELGPELADRVAAGHDVSFGAIIGQRLAGYGWCALGSIEAEHTGGVALTFPSHIGYMYKGFTHPDFRGQGINRIRVALAGQALAERGIRQLVCLVDWTNWASIQSCRRSGSQVLGQTVTFRLAGRRYWFLPEAARQLGICIGDKTEARAARLVTDAMVVAA